MAADGSKLEGYTDGGIMGMFAEKGGAIVDQVTVLMDNLNGTVTKLDETVSQVNGILEEPRRDMGAPGLAGRFPTFQIRIEFHHVAPEVILPLGKILLVSNNLLGTEPVIGRDGNKTKVHVGRFLVHMHHSRNISCFILSGFHKVHSPLEKQTNFFRTLVCEKFRTCGDQGFNYLHAVFSGTAASLPDHSVCFSQILALGLYQMKVEFAALQMDIRIAGIALLGSFIMRFDPAHRGAFILGEAQDRILCLHSFFSTSLARLDR